MLQLINRLYKRISSLFVAWVQPFYIVSLLSLMFGRQRPSSAPDQIYASSLSTLYQGYALWYPEPHVTGELHIGDVGYIRDGAFIRLLNIDPAAPKQKNVTSWDPPFEIGDSLPPNAFKLDSRREPLEPDHYRSHGVERVSLHGSLDV